MNFNFIASSHPTFEEVVNNHQDKASLMLILAYPYLLWLSGPKSPSLTSWPFDHYSLKNYLMHFKTNLKQIFTYHSLSVFPEWINILISLQMQRYYSLFWKSRWELINLLNEYLEFSLQSLFMTENVHKLLKRPKQNCHQWLALLYPNIHGYKIENDLAERLICSIL